MNILLLTLNELEENAVDKIIAAIADCISLDRYGVCPFFSLTSRLQDGAEQCYNIYAARLVAGGMREVV